MVNCTITKFIDSDQEELLADLGAHSTRENLRDVPIFPFEDNMTIKAHWLSSHIGEHMEVDSLVRTAQKCLDIYTFKTTMNQLYEIIEAKAPERQLDLDLAFALFPPSKIHHIQRLVSKWTTPEGITGAGQP